MSGLAHRVFRNARYIVGGRLFSQLTRFLYVLLLTRSLSAVEYGQFAHAQAFYLVSLPLIAMGTREVMATALGRDPDAGREVAHAALALRLIALVATLLVLGVSVLFVSVPDERALLMTSLAALAGRAAAAWSEHVMVACEHGRLALRQELIFRPIEVIAAVCVLALGGDLVALMVTHALAWWAQALQGLVVVQGRLFTVGTDFRPAALSRLVRQGVGPLIASVTYTWLLSAPLLVFEARGGDPHNTGQLALVLQVLQFLAVWPALMGQAALPVLAGAGARAERGHVRFLERLLPVMVLVAALLTALGEVLGPWIVPLVFGPSFSAAGRQLGLALLALPLASVAVTLSQAALAAGATGHSGAAAVVAVLVWLTVSVGMPAPLQIEPALASIGLGLLAWVLVLALHLHRSCGLRTMRTVLMPLCAGGLLWCGLRAVLPPLG